MFEKLSRAMRGNQNARKRLVVGGALAGTAAATSIKLITNGMEKSAKSFIREASRSKRTVSNAVRELNTAVTDSVKAVRIMNKPGITAASSKRAKRAVEITTNRLNNKLAALKTATAIAPAARSNARKSMNMAASINKNSKILVGGAALIGGIAAQRS